MKQALPSFVGCLIFVATSTADSLTAIAHQATTPPEIIAIKARIKSACIGQKSALPACFTLSFSGVPTTILVTTETLIRGSELYVVAPDKVSLQVGRHILRSATRNLPSQPWQAAFIWFGDQGYINMNNNLSKPYLCAG